MATLIEIYDIAKGDLDNKDLRKRVAIAALIKAEDIIGEVPPVDPTRLSWANATLMDPVGQSLGLFHYVLAANDGASQSAILSASDVAVQTNVDAAIDALYPAA